MDAHHEQHGWEWTIGERWFWHVSSHTIRVSLGRFLLAAKVPLTVKHVSNRLKSCWDTNARDERKMVLAPGQREYVCDVVAEGRVE